jgi:hypothetical protein
VIVFAAPFLALEQGKGRLFPRADAEKEKRGPDVELI